MFTQTNLLMFFPDGNKNVAKINVDDSKIHDITIVCYGQTETHSRRDRKKLAEYYLQGAMECEGSESQRYLDIYSALIDKCVYINSDTGVCY